MRGLMGWARGQPARDPTDDVFPVHELDACDDMANMVVWTMLRFDEVLDAEMLRDSLARLPTIGDWRKLGARIRMNAAGKLEYHIPKQFTEDRPAVAFTSEVHRVRVDDHELGRKLPRATPGKASVQAGCATFDSFAPPPEAPRTLKDYLRSGAPLLWLHVVTFADATLVTLGWPHMAMDGVGLSQVLQAWAVVLAGGDEFVPPMLSLRYDPMGTLTAKDGPAAKIPEEEFFMAEEMVTNVLLYLLCIVYLVVSLMFGDKMKQHMVWVPKATLVKLRQEALAGLEALDNGAAPGSLGGGAKLSRSGTPKNKRLHKGGVDEKLFPRGIVADHVTGKPFISENDALMAFFTRAAACGRPRSSRLPVNLFSVVDVRDRIPTVTASIPGATQSVFLTNMVLSVQTLLPARVFWGDWEGLNKTSSSSSSSSSSAVSSSSPPPSCLGIIAGAARSHVAAGTTEPQLRAKGIMMVKAVRDHLPAMVAMAGTPRTALIMFSSLDVGTMYDSNMFEPAVVKGGGRLEDGNDDEKTGDSQQTPTRKLKGCTPVAFMVPRNGNVRLMSKMQLFTIGRGRGGAWVQGSLCRDVWKMVEEELAEIERR
ncbi:hypothetical protein MAPG_04115 [Magnaporthiopsis poae ATCC 64411]|uniref:Uncharacterized protein n=1 Tax=Magnaporthiopsis poae (strain ATCC 64411 / 73-15) TaxID=644358 RepID=A0A0C4DVV2_MAGP6|nr:hypothetical protein MAPG_04115 [Magnaporthiopsis poae ATCC 64411]